MWVSLISALIMPAAVLVGSRWGTSGIAAAWIVVFPPIMLLEFYRARRIDMRPWHFVSRIVPSLRASAAMTAAVLFTRAALPNSWSRALGLAVLLSVGVLAYTCALLLLDHGIRVIDMPER